MSFVLSSALPEDAQYYRAHFDRVMVELVARLPHTRVYSPRELEGLIGDGTCPKQRMIELLQTVGLIRKQVTLVSSESGFREGDGWVDSTAEYSEDIRFEVIGRPVMLIRDLKEIGGAVPYFISFYSAEGRTIAQQIHGTLSKHQIEGFFSADLQSGAPFKTAILDALRKVGTALLIETPGYHTRGRCRTERDFALARGIRVLRVGLCDRALLAECPNWLNDNIQHTNYNATSQLAFEQAFLGTPLPTRPALELRRRAALSLVEGVSAAEITTLAAKLNLEDELSGAAKERRVQICNAGFRTETQADRFCAELDLLPLF
jgi:hypothetical protein